MSKKIKIAFPPGCCSECGNQIKVMCYLGTGVCSGACEKRRTKRYQNGSG